MLNADNESTYNSFFTQILETDVPGNYGVNDAINSLRPGALYQLENIKFTKWWHRDAPPTLDEIFEECKRLKSIAYKECRQNEYPSLGDFADAYYWQSKGVQEPMQEYLEKVEKIKLKYPKPKD